METRKAKVNEEFQFVDISDSDKSGYIFSKYCF